MPVEHKPCEGYKVKKCNNNAVRMVSATTMKGLKWLCIPCADKLTDSMKGK